MKSFVISMLFAAAAAQAGYQCVNPGDAWTVEDLSGSGDATDAATCKAACQTFINADEAVKVAKDWCCAVSVEGDLVNCDLLSFATAADAEIRAEAEAVEGTTFEAWAWAAGVEIVEEEEGAEDDAEEDDAEDDEDMSVRMTLSALATASIAMLAM